MKLYMRRHIFILGHLEVSGGGNMIEPLNLSKSLFLIPRFERRRNALENTEVYTALMLVLKYFLT